MRALSIFILSDNVLQPTVQSLGAAADGERFMSLLGGWLESKGLLSAKAFTGGDALINTRLGWNYPVGHLQSNSSSINPSFEQRSSLQDIAFDRQDKHSTLNHY